MRTATITEIKGLSIQMQQNTFVLFTLVKLTLDERKTLTKISMRKPLTTIPQTSTHLGHEGTRKPANCNLWRKAVCNLSKEVVIVLHKRIHGDIDYIHVYEYEW